MKRISILILIACTHPRPFFKGMPNAAEATCGEFDSNEATCVVDGKTYSCIAEDHQGCDHKPDGIVNCALTEQPAMHHKTEQTNVVVTPPPVVVR